MWGSGSAWADTLTEDFNSVTLSGTPVTTYYYSELSNGWKIAGGGYITAYDSYSNYTLGSTYKRGGSGNAIYANYGSSNSSYVIIPTKLTGDVTFYARRVSKNAASIYVYEAVESGNTYTTTGSALLSKTYSKLSNYETLPTTWEQLTVSLGDEGKMLAIQLVYTAIDDLSGEIFEEGGVKKPTNVAYSNLAYNGATISWSKGDNADAEWQVAYGAAGFDVASEGTKEVVNTTSYDITGLTELTEYDVYVRTKNGDEYSGWTSKISFTTPEQYVKPTALKIDSRVGTSATISWTAGSSETAWELVYSTNSAADPNTLGVTAVNSTPSHTLTGLTVGNTYYVWVRAKYGESQFSGWVNNSFSLTYTAASPSSVDGSGITNVTFGSGAEVLNSNDRPTSSPYYGDYSVNIGGATAGQSSNLAITFSTGYTYGTVVWVDWNQNYEFENSEIVFAGECGTSKPTTLDASFNIPALQAPGNYRMRIAAADSYYDSHKTMATAAGADPYPTSTYCIVHDYTLKVNEAADYSMSISGSDVSENTIAFGTVKNTTTTKTFTITNDGGSDLTDISVVSGDAEVFTVSDTGFDLASGATKVITVTFVKAVDGYYSKNITISQANIATPIVLTATATYATPTPATMAVTLDDVAVGATVAFGTVNKSTTKTFKVSNTGEATLNATIELSGTDAAKFTLSTNSLVVAGGANETFTVTFDSDDEDVAKTAIVTLSASGLDNVAFNVTGTYSDFWTEDFEGGALPTGWVITPGSYSGNSYAWHIGTYSDYENKTNMAIAPTSTTYNTIISPRLAAKKDDVLTWDAYFNWSDEYMTVEWSNDGETGWTTIYDQYKPTDESVSTRYYHKEMSFTAPADGNYYLRFTSRYSNGVDNFSGFKLNIPEHAASLTINNVPASATTATVYTATATVKELAGKDETNVKVQLYVNGVVVDEKTNETLNADETKVFSVSYTPISPLTSVPAYVKVTIAEGQTDEVVLQTSTSTLTISAKAITLDEEDASFEYTNGATYDVSQYHSFAVGFNTLSLPYNVTKANFASFGLGEAQIFEFTGYDEGNLELTRKDYSTMADDDVLLEATKPYIIYSDNAVSNYNKFTIGEVILSTATTPATFGGASFVPSYLGMAAGTLTGKYGVVSTGKIQKAGDGASIKGFRAYFVLPAAGVKGINYEGFDDATSINGISLEGMEEGQLYDLSGRRVNPATTRLNGIYILNGKKVLFK